MKTELNSRREPLILFKRVMGDDSVGLRPPVGPSGPCETLSQDAEWAVSESHSSIFLTITSCTTPLSQVWHVLIRDSNSYILSFSSVNAQRSLSVQSVWALSLTCRILTMSWLSAWSSFSLSNQEPWVASGLKLDHRQILFRMWHRTMLYKCFNFFRAGRVLQGTTVPCAPSLWIPSDLTPPCLHLSVCNPESECLFTVFLGSV